VGSATWEAAKLLIANPICFMLFWHWDRRAASRADCTAGSNIAIKMPMMVITTNNSINVKPFLNHSLARIFCFSLISHLLYFSGNPAPVWDHRDLQDVRIIGGESERLMKELRIFGQFHVRNMLPKMCVHKWGKR
jgi:hypothetical protein